MGKSEVIQRLRLVLAVETEELQLELSLQLLQSAELKALAAGEVQLSRHQLTILDPQ